MINETTANYIASTFRQAIGRIKTGRTLKEALARVEAELHSEVDGVDAEECRAVWNVVKGSTRKERFIGKCSMLADDYAAEAARASTRCRANQFVNRARKDGYCVPGSVALDVVLRIGKAEGWWYSEALALFKSELAEAAAWRVVERIRGQANAAEALLDQATAKLEAHEIAVNLLALVIENPPLDYARAAVYAAASAVNCWAAGERYTNTLEELIVTWVENGQDNPRYQPDWNVEPLQALEIACASYAAMLENTQKPAPRVEEYRTAVISTAHMMPSDWDLLAEHAIDTATDNGLFWVHDTPCGSILRFKASHNWREELTELRASVMLITTINAMESLGFDAVHFDRDADTVEGLDVSEEVDA